MNDPSINSINDPSNEATHLAEVRRRVLEPRQQPNPKTPFTARQERAFVSAAKKAEIFTDIEVEWSRQAQVANDLAEKHGIRKQEMQRRVQRTSAFKGQKRGPNAWNAYIHVKAMDVNKDVPDGQKTRLQELQDLAKENDYSFLSDEAKRELKEALEQARDIRQKTTRNRATAVMHDVHATSTRVFHELGQLNQRAEMASMCFIVRTTPTNSSNPSYFVDEGTRRFIETTFKKTAEELAVLYEAFMVSHIKGMAQTSTVAKLTGKANIRTIIGDGLRAITHDPKAEMSWKRYEDRVVNIYSVYLKNWPASVTFNPDSMSSKDVRIVLAALEDGICVWEKLGGDELRERQAQIQRQVELGELAVKERKCRNDKGVPRGPYKRTGNEKKRRSSPHVYNDPSDNESPVSRKKARVVSSPFVHDDSGAETTDKEEGGSVAGGSTTISA